MVVPPAEAPAIGAGTTGVGVTGLATDGVRGMAAASVSATGAMSRRQTGHFTVFTRLAKVMVAPVALWWHEVAITVSLPRRDRMQLILSAPGRPVQVAEVHVTGIED